MRWRIPPDNSCGYCRSTRAGSVICTSPSKASARSSARCRVQPRISTNRSVICGPIRREGFSAVSGSCGISAQVAPTLMRRAAGGSAKRSTPSSMIWPDIISTAFGKIPKTALPIIDLPAPLSPTKPRTSPTATSNDTSRSKGPPPLTRADRLRTDKKLIAAPDRSGSSTPRPVAKTTARSRTA